MINPFIEGHIAQFLSLDLYRLVFFIVERLILRNQRMILVLFAVGERLHVHNALVTHHIASEHDGCVALAALVGDQSATRLDLKVEAGDVVEDRLLGLALHGRAQVQEHGH